MAKKTRYQTLIDQLKLVGNTPTERQPSTKWTRVTYNNHVLTGAPIKREFDYYLWVSRSTGAVRRGPALYQSDSCPNLANAVILAATVKS
jgi:hypothetical protein